MAAIFNFRHIRMPDSIPASLFVLPDPKNMGIAVEISLLSCIEAEIYFISFILPVNCRHLRFPTYPVVGQSLHLSSVLPSFESMAQPLEFRCHHVYKLRYVKLHFSAAIFDFWLPVSSGSVTYSAIEKFDPENMGVADGILFLASLEA